MRDRGEPRLLMIVGGSGSGKSSLLRASVLPQFDRNRDWLVLPTLRYGQSPNSYFNQSRI
jgi:ABC-type phosphate/phosphonate transport system ATPase subunit